MAWPKTYFQNWPPDYFLTQARHKQGHSKEGVKLLPLQDLVDYIASVMPTPGPGDHNHPRLVEENISQVAHGFVTGDILKFDSSVYAKAQANSAENAEVVGMVYRVIDANSFDLLIYGRARNIGTYIDNTTYFLSPTIAGASTTIVPTAVGQVSKPLFRTVSTNVIYFYNWRGIEITSGENIKSGRQSFADDANTITVTFDTPFTGKNYSVGSTIENIVDADSAMYSYVITAKDRFGFVVELMGNTDSANYVFEWVARYD